jgi:signal transduction histidine kinase
VLLLCPETAEKTHVFLEDALKNAQKGLNETRNILKKLHDISRKRGMAEITGIIRLFRESTGIAVTFNMGDCPETWGGDLDYVFYRIIQEGLVNSVKHGRATEVSISFWQTDGDIVLSISDNGKGGAEGGGESGIGLQGMRERLSRFNGTVETQSHLFGFVLIVRVPKETARGDDAYAGN